MINHVYLLLITKWSTKEEILKNVVVFVRSLRVDGVQSCFHPNVLPNVSFYVLKRRFGRTWGSVNDARMITLGEICHILLPCLAFQIILNVKILPSRFLHFTLLLFAVFRECPNYFSSSSFSFFGFLFSPIERPFPECTCVVGERNNRRKWADIQTNKALSKEPRPACLLTALTCE